MKFNVRKNENPVQQSNVQLNTTRTSAKPTFTRKAVPVTLVPKEEKQQEQDAFFKNKASEPFKKTNFEKKNDKSMNTNMNQIIRFDGNGCFFEVLKGGFHLQRDNCVGKVHLNFVDYDKTTFSQKNMLKCYMDIDKWLAWEKQYRSGYWIELEKEARSKQKSGGYAFCSDIRQSLGGGYEDGKLVSRQLKVTPGNKQGMLVFSCEYYEGEENETGLIVPKGRALKTVRVPLTYEQVDALFEMVHIQIQAFYNHQAVGSSKAMHEENSEKNMEEHIMKLENKIKTLEGIVEKTYELLRKATE